jgi:hypothetical protein
MELKGQNGYAAYQAYLRVMFFLPMHRNFEGGERDDAIESFKLLEDREKKKTLLDLMATANVGDRDFNALLSVHKSKAGIYITSQVAAAMPVDEVVRLSLGTLLECSKIDTELFF